MTHRATSSTAELSPEHLPEDERRPPRHFSRLILFVALAVVLFVAGGTLVWINTSPSIEPASEASPAAAVDVAAASIESIGGPDAVVAAFDKGEITDVRAIGDNDYDADTPFYVGSLTKTFTAAVVSRLIDQGEISPDQPVVDYLPWFQTQGAYDQITVRNLLNQTSGIPTAVDLPDLTTPERSFKERATDLKDVELVSAPGEEFHYSNKNFVLLGLVVEAATGQSYDAAVHAEVIEPLGLANTFTDPTEATERSVADGNLPMFGAQLPSSAEPYPGALADGYMVSSASDLATFADVLATGSYGGQSYLSATTLEAMHAPPEGVEPDPTYDSTYGFGLRLKEVNGQQMYFHEGQIATLHANVGVLPDSRTGIVVIAAQGGQLYDGDAPFFAGMDRLTGHVSDEVPDGGYRMIALTMVALAALVLAAMIIDVTRWSTLGRRTRRRRLIRSVVPRIVAAAVVWAGVFFGLGAMLGQSGPIPFEIAWGSAPDLTATVLASVGYLVVSAVVIAAWPVRSGTGGARPGLAVPAE